MKTITLNKKTMNLKLVVCLLAILILPLTAIAQQDLFEKYSNNVNVDYVSIEPKMFQMIAKMGINVDDPETKAYMNMVNSITSFKTIVTNDKAIAADIAKWVKSRAITLEELMETRQDGTIVKFYVKEGKDADHVKELLIFVNGDVVGKVVDSSKNKSEQQNEKAIIVLLKGDINLNEISKLTSKMNIPRGEHLERKQ